MARRVYEKKAQIGLGKLTLGKGLSVASESAKPPYHYWLRLIAKPA